MSGVASKDKTTATVNGLHNSSHPATIGVPDKVRRARCQLSQDAPLPPRKKRALQKTMVPPGLTALQALAEPVFDAARAINSLILRQNGFSTRPQSGLADGSFRWPSKVRPKQGWHQRSIGHAQWSADQQ